MSHRRLALVSGVAVIVIAAAMLAAAMLGPTVETTVVQEGLEVPWDLDFTPDGRMLVTERPGRIRLYASAEPGAELLDTVDVPNVRAEGEAGLMGIAVDADYPNEPYVYVCASLDPDGEEGAAPWHNALLRYRLGDDDGHGLALDGTLFDEPMVAAVHHNGCALEMDAERRLWFTMGDGSISAAQTNPAQDPASLNGKILRLEADGSVPEDNPTLPGAAGPSAVWSIGHRNPQGLAFAPDGSLYAAEHGTDTDDEINRIVRGGNYGYACWTDAHNRGPAHGGAAGAGCEPPSAYLAAAWASGAPTIAISGARFVDGEAWGAWDGSLMVTTLKNQDLRRFELRDDGARLEVADVLLHGRFGRLRAVAVGPDGALYVTTSNGSDDKVIRLAVTLSR